MEVVLVSACEKRAIARTRAILDRYATRMGNGSWATRITSEGLQTLHAALRRTASRSTAVLCLLRQGRGHALRLQPLWVVWARDRFSVDGATPAFETQRATRTRTVDVAARGATWVLDVRRVAALGGLFHDLGKNNRFFAAKILRTSAIADPIRHEWISAFLLAEIIREAPSKLDAIWQRALNAAGNDKPGRDAMPLLDAGVCSAADAVMACVATHHRLYEEFATNSGRLGPHAFLRSEIQSSKESVPRAWIREQAAAYPTDLEARVLRAARKLRAEHDTPRPEGYWRGVALLARAALILADHKVSSEAMPQGHPREAPFANSEIGPDGCRQPRQSLPWHLQSVSAVAATMVDRMLALNTEVEYLGQQALDTINAHATGRFVWQEEAAEAVSQARAAHPGTPMLLQVIASTGSGKTRACARFATLAAVDGSVRFATALNLRTLTLQTGAAYAQQLGIPADALAVVIGDTMTRRAFEAQRHADTANEDEMVRDLGEDIEVRGVAALPSWLDHFVQGNQNLRAMLGAPVLVTTADYLVSAAEPGAQARHVLPLLRLWGSDLVLDEVDTYDATSVAAILRLVQMAAFLGRNVIVSSATLTGALASALVRYYEHGAQLRASLRGQPGVDFVLGTVSDLASPSIHRFVDTTMAEKSFDAHVAQIGAALAASAHLASRRAELLPVVPSKDGFFDAICQGAARLHGDHRWRSGTHDKFMSIGLVRVANIQVAIRVAKCLRACPQLAGLHPKVLCYHSGLLNGHRWMIESRLDRILSRGGDPCAPAGADPSIDQHLRRQDVREGVFIVVATPVEEVGRDHDFDWAVIEPSSAQSIVQTAGRVHRHRTDPVRAANVAILQFNMRACRGDRPAFVMPGNEGQAPYFTHDLQQLLAWEPLRESLDARLRFDRSAHALTRLDDAALETYLAEPYRRMLQSPSLWLSQRTYQHWPLRGCEPSDRLRYEPHVGWSRFELHPNGRWGFQPLSEQVISGELEPMRNAWMHFGVDAIASHCRNAGLDPEWALEVELSNQSYDDQVPRLEVSFDGIRYEWK